MSGRERVMGSRWVEQRPLAGPLLTPCSRSARLVGAQGSGVLARAYLVRGCDFIDSTRRRWPSKPAPGQVKGPMLLSSLINPHPALHAGSTYTFIILQILHGFAYQACIVFILNKIHVRIVEACHGFYRHRDLFFGTSFDYYTFGDGFSDPVFMQSRDCS